MSGSAKKLLHAAAGTAAASGSATYVENVFSTFLYAGNNTNGTEIVNGIDLDDKGGMVWLKRRDGSFAHFLFNTASSAAYHYLSTDSANGVNTGSSDTLVDFNDDGFTLDDDNSYVGGMNTSGHDYASWTFAKQAGFFDIVTFTGDATSNRAISHNLDATIGSIFLKRTDDVEDWYVYHRNIDSDLSNAPYYKLVLNGTAAKANNGSNGIVGTSTSTFTVHGTGNTSSATYVAYIFAAGESDSQVFGEDSDESIIKCGEFSTDGSGNTSLVSCGWEPGWLITKRRDGTSNWTMMDNMRYFSQTQFAPLYADATNAETVDANDRVVPSATGFQGTGGQFSANAEYVFMAIRRGPMKEPTAGTDVYTPVRPSASGTFTAVSGFPTDLTINKDTSSGGTTYLGNRLTGLNSHNPTSTALPFSVSFAFDFMNQITIGGTGDYSAWISWNFRRYPKVYDAVNYTGAGAGTHAHNLTAVPELMIIKCTSHTNRWIVYHKDMGNTKQLHWDEDIAETTGHFNDTTPTASVFSVSDNTQSGTSGRTYMALLFATLAGVSKVGSYTGTAADLNVDCGFSGGARFVMIKRSDSTGDWYVFDTVTGIVSGNEAYNLMNTTTGVQTAADYIDPLASGFTVTSSAPAGLNASSGEYIYLAFA